MTAPIRGRILARRKERALLRTAHGDVETTLSGNAKPGDIVEIEGSTVTQQYTSFQRGDYPTPSTECARLSADRISHLQSRGKILRSIRDYFWSQGFTEIEAPLLVPTPGLELHLEGVSAGENSWLITSPEFQMKRLLVGGLEKIFSICKCFRANEVGHHHNVEFTMLEWYRAYEDLSAIIADTEQIIANAAMILCGNAQLPMDDGPIDLTPPWPQMTVADAMANFVGVRVYGDETAEELGREFALAGISLGNATHWDDIFYTAFLEKVEPQLAKLKKPIFLVDWPTPLAALAKRKEENPHVVERFELYIGGVELANAFGELTDATEQRQRFEEDVRKRKERQKPCYPLDERFLNALEEGMPPSAGIALGIDRLAMLLCGAKEIKQVLAFTADEL